MTLMYRVTLPPSIAILFVMLLVVTYYPELSLWLVQLVGTR